MSFGQNAIIARMGIDLTSLKGDLTAAEKLAVRASNRMTSELNKAAKGGGGHGGGSSGGHGKGMTARPFGDAINAATGGSGAVNEVGMLSHLVGNAGVAAGGILLVKTLHEMAKAMAEVHKANQDLEKTLGRGTQAWWEQIPGVPSDLKKGMQAGERPVNSMDGMRARRDELAEKSAAAEKSRGFWATMGSATFGAAGNDTITKSIKLQQDADTERLRLDKAIAGTVLSETQAREVLLHQSRRDGELALIRLETAQKIAAITDQVNNGKMGVQEGAAQKKAVSAGGENKSIAVNLREDAAKREADLELRLNYIRLQGDDASVKAAYARLDAAKDLVVYAQTAEERTAGQAKVETAELEYYFAQKTRDEERRGQTSEIAMAELRADADTKHLAALVAERGLIDATMNDPRTRPDEKRGLAVKIAQNSEAQRNAANTLAMNAFDAAGSQVEAGMGVGQAEQQRAARERIRIEQERLATMLKTKEVSQKADNEQLAKIMQMRRAWLEVAHTIALANAAANAQTGEMALQLAHQTTIGDAVKEQFDYAQKIEEAQRNGNTELAGQLQKQKELALALAVQRAGEAKQEARGLTLGDLAKKGGTFGHRARQVDRLEQRADRLRGQGRIGESDALHNRADAARRGLERAGVLKPSEASKDMAKAMDASQVLQAIRNNTAKPVANRK